MSLKERFDAQLQRAKNAKKQQEVENAKVLKQRTEAAAQNAINDAFGRIEEAFLRGQDCVNVYDGDEGSLILERIKEILTENKIPFEVSEPDEDSGYIRIDLTIKGVEK